MRNVQVAILLVAGLLCGCNQSSGGSSATNTGQTGSGTQTGSGNTGTATPSTRPLNALHGSVEQYTSSQGTDEWLLVGDDATSYEIDASDRQALEADGAKVGSTLTFEGILNLNHVPQNTGAWGLTLGSYSLDDFRQRGELGLDPSSGALIFAARDGQSYTLQGSMAQPVMSLANAEGLGLEVMGIRGAAQAIDVRALVLDRTITWRIFGGMAGVDIRQTVDLERKLVRYRGGSMTGFLPVQDFECPMTPAEAADIEALLAAADVPQLAPVLSRNMMILDAPSSSVHLQDGSDTWNVGISWWAAGNAPPVPQAVDDLGQALGDLSAAMQLNRLSTDLEEGSFSAKADPNDAVQHLVINEQAELDAFWSEHKPHASPPAVDLSSKTVLVVIDTTRTTSGYDIAIGSITETAGNLVVEVQMTTPGPTPVPSPQPQPIVVQPITSSTVTSSQPTITAAPSLTALPNPTITSPPIIAVPMPMPIVTRHYHIVTIDKFDRSYSVSFQ